MKTTRERRTEQGFTLITTGICAMAMLGVTGLAVDLGRMYVVRNEMQAFTDSAALSAALELDGTQAGFSRARTVVANNTNRWNLGTAAFAGAQTDFSNSATGPWGSNPATADLYRFIRVRTSGQVSLFFLPAVTTSREGTLSAASIAAQVEKTEFSEGLFPFSPLTHGGTPSPPDYGFVPGQVYALRWGVNVAHNSCAGDMADPAWVARIDATGNSERGYIEETSASLIRQAIEDNYQARPLEIGDTVTLTDGNKETERDSI